MGCILAYVRCLTPYTVITAHETRKHVKLRMGTHDVHPMYITLGGSNTVVLELDGMAPAWVQVVLQHGQTTLRLDAAGTAPLEPLPG